MYETMKKAPGRKLSLAMVLCLSFTMMLSGCGGNNNNAAPTDAPAATEAPAATAADNNQKSTNNAEATADGSPLDLAMKGEYKGTKVTMFGPFVDADQVKFESSIKEFEEKPALIFNMKAPRNSKLRLISVLTAAMLRISLTSRSRVSWLPLRRPAR